MLIAPRYHLNDGCVKQSNLDISGFRESVPKIQRLDRLNVGANGKNRSCLFGGRSA